jgi:hypothetical protein
MFGCGAGCREFHIVHSVTGKVYDRFGIADLPDQWLAQQSDDPLRIQFTASSRLLRVNGCPNEHDCGYYDYVMIDGKGLKLVDKSLLPQEFQ